jgi:hypothetical protein
MKWYTSLIMWFFGLMISMPSNANTDEYLYWLLGIIIMATAILYKSGNYVIYFTKDGGYLAPFEGMTDAELEVYEEDTGAQVRTDFSKPSYIANIEHMIVTGRVK